MFGNCSQPPSTVYLTLYLQGCVRTKFIDILVRNHFCSKQFSIHAMVLKNFAKIKFTRDLSLCCTILRHRSGGLNIHMLIRGSFLTTLHIIKKSIPIFSLYLIYIEYSFELPYLDHDLFSYIHEISLEKRFVLFPKV